ncbi:MAG: methyltransferase domain-containing protein [Alphaproteobacteria bacterium]|nr:methyltransferase domain-containing protein [Alphaproteobacteria bacterium]
MSAPALSARAAALRILRAVLGKSQPLDEALADPEFDRLESRERAFARLLAATVLRRLGQIDEAVNACLDRPLAGGARAIAPVLDLGAAQILFLGTPPHAAVAATVELAGGRLAPWRGLANAVLRRLTRDGAALLAAQDAARLNTPDWLWRSWSGAYGEATARAIAEASCEEPPLDITVKDDAAGWAARLEATVLPTGSLRRMPAAVAALPGFAEGAWWVQDAAAAVPATLFGDVAGKHVVDLCAAPGGKTAQLAARGAHVTAVDRSAPRLDRLRENLARLGLAAECVVGDAANWRPPAPVDAVLLDAPCTATGTLRRHPDVARLKRPDDVARLAATQDRLLAAASAMLRPGGTLVFCTCSLQPEEGPQRVAALLAGGAPLDLVPVAPAEVGGLAEIVAADGTIRTLPCHLAGQGGLDGFFVARLRRR